MQGVIERAEFWLWYEYNKQDLGHWNKDDLATCANLYVLLRQDGRQDIQAWLERTKRQIQLCQSPFLEQWRRLQKYEEGFEEAA